MMPVVFRNAPLFVRVSVGYILIYAALAFVGGLLLRFNAASQVFGGYADYVGMVLAVIFLLLGFGIFFGSIITAGVLMFLSFWEMYSVFYNYNVFGYTAVYPIKSLLLVIASIVVFMHLGLVEVSSRESKVRSQTKAEILPTTARGAIIGLLASATILMIFFIYALSGGLNSLKPTTVLLIVIPVVTASVILSSSLFALFANATTWLIRSWYGYASCAFMVFVTFGVQEVNAFWALNLGNVGVYIVGFIFASMILYGHISFNWILKDCLD